jgi:hypothetical protein
MHSSMATNIPKEAAAKPGETTEFQLHKSQQAIFGGILKYVVDFTERKLSKCIEQTNDESQKTMLSNLLKEYVAGKVAVAWRRGRPVWIKVTKA